MTPQAVKVLVNISLNTWIEKDLDRAPEWLVLESNTVGSFQKEIHQDMISNPSNMLQNGKDTQHGYLEIVFMH